MHWIDALRAWAGAHPYLMTAVVWPFVLGLVTLCLKPRTPDDYSAIASMSPTWFFARLAVVLQLVAAIGIDPVKVTKLIQKLVTPTLTALAVFVSAIVLGACAAFQKVAPYLPPPEDDACIINEVEHGITDPVKVIADCHLVDVAVHDVELLIEGAVQAKGKRPKTGACGPVCADAGGLGCDAGAR